MLMGEPFSRRETPSLESESNKTNPELLGQSAEMASGGNPVQDLCEEATCPICLDYFRDPVIITECGHNFCRGCLSQAEGGRETSCPQCRRTFQEGSLLPNRQLVRVVDIAKKLRFQEPKVEGGKGGVCGKHQEPLRLFCKDDEALICLVCDRAKEHRGHEVIPLEEAPPGYKKKIASCLKSLKKLQEEICTYKAETEKESQDLLKQTKADREKTVLEFRQLREFLDVQEKHLLAQIEEVEKEIARKRDDKMAKLSEKLSCLKDTIQEMEKKCLQPASEFLQDIKSTLQRYEAQKEFKKSVVFPLELKWRIWEFWDTSPFLEGVMKQFKKKLVSGLALQKANLTLDPNTSHPTYILSDGNQHIDIGKPRFCASSPERFDKVLCVLGREQFTAGRHFWEFSAPSDERWGVGVARKSVKRNGVFKCGPTQGYWLVRNCEIAGHPGLPVQSQPEKIRVSLNCEGGRVAIFDADTAALIYAFSTAAFSGEALLPVVHLCKITTR